MLRRRPRRLLSRRRRFARRHPALRVLRRVHRLLDDRQYAEAYPILDRLAEDAAQLGMPVQAANLYLQAARACLEMGDAQDAVALARRAIQLLVDAGQGARVTVLLPRLIQALNDRGFPDQAAALRAEVEALAGAPQAATPPPRHGRLPARCPSCNGPVRADEVVWINSQSAECVYCGSVIQAE
jgi:tetratricopeptide (TPR) repeat protein